MRMISSSYKIVIDLDDTIYSQQKFTEYWHSLDPRRRYCWDLADHEEYVLLDSLIHSYPTVILTDSGLAWLPEKLRLLSNLQNIPLMNAKHSTWRHIHKLSKPEDCLFRYSMWYLQGTPEDTVFIGNRITDIPSWAKHGFLYTRYCKKHSGRDLTLGHKEVDSIKEILSHLELEK